MKTVYLILIAALLLASCSKDEDDSPQPNNNTVPNNSGGNNITINSVPQVWMKIDGNVYSKIEDGINITSGVGADKEVATLPDTSSGIYGSFLYDNNTLNSYFSVDKGTIFFFGAFPADTTAFKNFFSPASYSYSAGGVNGIVISFHDSNGVLWSTDQGSGDQAGSTFVITHIRTENIFDFTVVFRATFNCKVYNSTGQSKTLTEGVCLGAFANL